MLYTSMVLLILTLLTSCASVEIKDSEWVGSLGEGGGVAYHLLTNETHDLTHDEVMARWNNLNQPQVMTSVDTLLDWKADIEKLCSDSGECTIEQQKTQSRLLELVNRVEGLNLQKE